MAPRGDGPGDYLTRVAVEERRRGRDDETRRRTVALEDARRRRDRVFEANKHLSTLCATGVGLVLVLGRLGVAEVDVILGLFAFGVPLIETMSALVVTAVVPESHRKTGPTSRLPWRGPLLSSPPLSSVSGPSCS